MSNKQFRQPANPDYKPEAAQAEAAQPEAVTASPAPVATETTQAKAVTDNPAPAATVTAPAETQAADVPPWGNNQDWPDMRYPIRRVTGGLETPITDVEAAAMLAVCDRFCQQIVEITAMVLETIPVGEVRQLVAAEMAPTGAMITQDGKIRKPEDLPPAAADPAKRPRASGHPLITLIKLAMQAVKHLGRTLAGTHPKVARKRNDRVTPEKEETYEQIYRKMGQYLKVT